MLDLRLYRLAFLPLLLALVVAAFSLRHPPAPLTTTLAPDAFDGGRAAQLLGDLASRFPDRRPGSPGDDAVADRVARTFRHLPGFTVTERRFDAGTIDGTRSLRTVVAERPGQSSRRLVVVAHRDAAGHGDRADLSGTAALLELADVFGGAITRHTLTLVSTSGGSGGAAGAAELAGRLGRDVDAVIALGDLAGTSSRRPWVVPWSDGRGQAPLRLQRTVDAALGQEVGGGPGAPSSTMQFLRMAFPLTVGEQGPLQAANLPSVLVGPGGELGGHGEEATSADRMRQFGRGVLRALTALDASAEPASMTSTAIATQHDVVPPWSVRLVVGALLLPALLGAVDAAFRVRRRRLPMARWALWALAGALPFVSAVLFALLLRATGLLAAPGEPAAPGTESVSAAALVATVAVLAAGWGLARLAVVRRLGLPGHRSAAGAGGPASGIGVALVLALVTFAVWIRNPFAAAFLVPAAHLWLLAAAAEPGARRRGAALAVAGGLVPLALAIGAYGLALHAGPVALAWLALVSVGGGHVGVMGALLGSLALGCGASALVVALRRHGATDETAIPLAPRREPTARTAPPAVVAGRGR